MLPYFFYVFVALFFYSFQIYQTNVENYAMSWSSGGEDLGQNSPLPPTSEGESLLGQSPTEQESLLGYSPTELRLGEQRKRNLSSVISRLSEVRS